MRQTGGLRSTWPCAGSNTGQAKASADSRQGAVWWARGDRLQHIESAFVLWVPAGRTHHARRQGSECTTAGSLRQAGAHGSSLICSTMLCNLRPAATFLRPETIILTTPNGMSGSNDAQTSDSSLLLKAVRLPTASAPYSPGWFAWALHSRQPSAKICAGADGCCVLIVRVCPAAAAGVANSSTSTSSGRSARCFCGSCC